MYSGYSTPGELAQIFSVLQDMHAEPVAIDLLARTSLCRSRLPSHPQHDNKTFLHTHRYPITLPTRTCCSALPYSRNSRWTSILWATSVRRCSSRTIQLFARGYFIFCHSTPCLVCFTLHYMLVEDDSLNQFEDNIGYLELELPARIQGSERRRDTSGS